MTGWDYVLAYLLFLGLALPLSILAAASAYQFTRRADLSIVLFAAFAALSLTLWADNWQLCWLNPCVWALSDDFSNFRIFRSVAYQRLTWLAALTGVWACPTSVSGSTERAFLAPWPAVPGGPTGRQSPCFCWLPPAPPMPPSPWWIRVNPDQSAMSFYEVPYAEGVLCTGRSAQIFPRHLRRHGFRTGRIPVSESIRAGAGGSLGHHSRLYRLLCTGKRHRGPILHQQLSGIQRGHADGDPPPGETGGG